MIRSLLAPLVLGLLPAQVPPPAAPAVQVAPRPAPPETDAQRLERLRALVVEAERAAEEDDEDTLTRISDEVDELTSEWSPELLKQAEVQALLQRMKDVLEQDQEATPGPESVGGLKDAGEVVAITGEDLRAELERVRAAEQGATYDFPIDLNDKVLTWVKLFTTSRRGFMENALGRASRYLPMVRQVFAEEGIPADLAYLGLIESGYRNEAKSRAKAVGMWQFIRATGRIYGLAGTAWVEERQDPMKATRAAARYLKRLYQITGDWYLAASSYNAGPLSLERAIQNTGTRNFWDLHRSPWLRTETKNYVPELCAAILIGHNPERYGLQVAPLAPYAYETVLVSSMTSLSVLARCADTDPATLRALNPELLRGTTPPGTYALRVPPGSAVECLRQLARQPAGKRLDFKTYTVKKGDTLAKVAKRFKVAPEDLLAANDLEARQFKAGRKVLVPPPPSLTVDDRDVGARTASVKPLSDRPLKPLPSALPGELGGPLPQEELAPARAQDAVSAVPPAGPPTPKATFVPKVPAAPRTEAAQARPEPAPAALQVPKAPRTTVVKAQPGDTLAKLARTHGIPFSTLLRLNPDAAKVLHPGDEVRVAEGAPAPRAAKAAPAARTAATHVVQKGETLSAIARKHDLDPEDLRTWNRLKGDHITVGQKLRLGP